MTMMFSCGLAALHFLGAASALVLEHNPERNFLDFVWEHRRSYQPGTDDFESRKELFEQRVVEIDQLNSREGVFVKYGVNPYADYTEAELTSLTGYDRHRRHSSFPLSFRRQEGGELHHPHKHRKPTQALKINESANETQIETQNETANETQTATQIETQIETQNGTQGTPELPEEVSWENRLVATSPGGHINQRSCGSCWAAGTTTVLRAHSELYKQFREFSMQQIVSCAPNPEECGGTGGCQGSTGELAMEHVMQVGLMEESSFPYQARDVPCPARVRSLMGGSQMLQTTSSNSQNLRIGGLEAMTGYQTLPINKAEPLMRAVVEKGPVAITVAVNGMFSFYRSGIYSDCQGWIVNHLVTLIGYGVEGENKFWHIQNSWGEYWGERGNMRLKRDDIAAEDANCGIDTKPEDGVGCKGGPPTAEVCGNCGILFDSVVPDFQLYSTGWFATHGRRTPDVTAL